GPQAANARLITSSNASHQFFLIKFIYSYSFNIIDKIKAGADTAVPAGFHFKTDPTGLSC
ncbi:MAG TPA: hypothetical protein PLK31_09650, partial [Chloroflexota bacterium]|nr:hypothetical protein [Chloroflexota bacterium]